jgi:hypothetical protein
MVGFCILSNETSVSIKADKFLENVSVPLASAKRLCSMNLVSR